MDFPLALQLAPQFLVDFGSEVLVFFHDRSAFPGAFVDHRADGLHADVC